LDDSPTYRRIRALAVPAILANAAVPTLGLVDTAIIARVGDAAALGAVALGAFFFNCLYWALGFLRMSTTGLVAQARGAGNDDDAALVLGRAAALGLLLGFVALVLQVPFAKLSLFLLDPSPQVTEQVEVYIAARMWGAPATLFASAASGALIGLGRMRALLVVQVAMNGLNLAFNLCFVFGLGWGVRGLGFGTALAETCAAVLSAWVIARSFSFRALWSRRKAVLDLRALSALVRVNGHLLLRTLALLLGFAWFSRQGAQLGDDVLASNHVVQQLISFCAFFLDGIAFVAEAFVGQAFGARDRGLFLRAVRRTSVVAACAGFLLSLSLLVSGTALVQMLTPLENVRALATANIPIAAAYVLVAVVAWQLDGIFIGATRGRELRDASLLSLALFLVAGYVLEGAYGNQGLWTAMLLYAGLRGATLAAFFPRLLQAVSSTPAKGPS
jgi:multidrug resistance protein, MATE family